MERYLAVTVQGNASILDLQNMSVSAVLTPSTAKTTATKLNEGRLAKFTLEWYYLIPDRREFHKDI